MPRMAGSVANRAPMHEQVNDRAQQQKPIWQHAEDVRFVLLPEKKDRDSQEDAEAQPHGRAKPLGSWRRFRGVLLAHSRTSICGRLVVHAAFVVGATCSVAPQRRAKKLWITTKSHPAYTP